MKPPSPIRSWTRPALLAACTVGALGAAVPARAQGLFDELIPPQIYGTDVQPDVTVGSRVRTGYDNGGIRAGTVVIRPRVVESMGYESNVLATSKAQGSALAETNAGLEARSDHSRFMVDGAIGVDDYRYLNLANQSYTNWSARLGGVYQLGQDSITVLGTHQNSNQTQRDLGTPNLTSPLPITDDLARLSYRAVFSHVILQPQLEVERFRYDSGIANGVLYDQTNRNRVVTTPRLTAEYEFATRRSAVLVVSNAIGRYSTGTATYPKRDFNDASVLAGLDYDLSGSLRARVLAGYGVRTFTSSTYKTIQAPIAELTVIYNPTGLTTVTGLVARKIQDSSAETTAAVTTLVGQLRVDHELRRNVILTVDGGISHYDYGSSGSQTLLTGAAGATYLLNRYMAATASYDVLSRKSTSGLSLNGSTAGSDYVDHRMLLQLKLAL